MRGTFLKSVAAVLCGAGGLLGGCSGPGMAPLVVHVSDAGTGEAIEGAKVVADTPSRNHPFSVETLLGQTGPVSEAAYTDEQGVAVVRYVSDRPVRIGVLARGYPILVRMVEQPWLGRERLVGDALLESGEKRLRVEVEPGR